MHRRLAVSWISLAVLRLVVAPGAISAQTSQVSEKEALPILQKCFQCHGESLQMSKLDLHTREAMLKGGENGPAIVPGDANASLLYKRISGAQQPVMPMKPMAPLATAEIATIRDWINQGAPWSGSATPVSTAKPGAASPYGSYREKAITEQDRKWWSFQQPKRPSPPAVADTRWTRNPIDAFIRDLQIKKGLEPAPEADRRTLIRRAYLDLEGLPPTPAEVEAFVNDPSPRAWENLIDRLLASPHYGERWGRFWLDVVRYADSSGFEFDIDIDNAWRYRDYVIRAFNTDKPYNKFIVEQLAGDEADQPTQDDLIGTTFYREGPRVRFREKNYPSYRYDYMDDIIRTTFQGFMGLSVNCARCHDHKFDPITRLDYYKSMAMFWGYIDYDQPLGPKEAVREYDSIRKEVERQTAPLYLQIAAIEKPYKEKQREKQVQDALKKFPEDIQTAIKTPADRRTPGQKLLVAQVLIGIEDSDPDGAALADLEAKRRIRVQQRANQIFGAAVQPVIKPKMKLHAEDDAKRAVLLTQIAEIEKQVPYMPVADGVRDGDYRLAPDGLGDSHIPGTGRPTYDVKCCFIPAARQKYEVPPLYFAANGGDIKADEQTFRVQPGFLKVLSRGNEPTSDQPNRTDYVTSGRRRALAEWIASKDNPLTARVMINRIWGWHFGTGLVATPGNFGRMGMAPSNPQLLDWLATEFVRQGWSIKQMQRLIMTSETYKIASAFYLPSNAEKDPTNVYLSAFPARRLEVEIIRDLTLAVSGTLNMKAGGEAFFPSLPRAVRAAQPRGYWELTQEGPDNWRRSVYAHRKRGLKYPMFEVFDEPDANVTCERRTVSTVPTQALTMLNNEFILLQADHFAERIRKEAADDPRAEVKLMYRIALSRDPNSKELSSNVAFLDRRRAARSDENAADASRAALTDLAHVVLNLNEFMYIR